MQSANIFRHNIMLPDGLLQHFYIIDLIVLSARLFLNAIEKETDKICKCNTFRFHIENEMFLVFKVIL